MCRAGDRLERIQRVQAAPATKSGQQVPAKIIFVKKNVFFIYIFLFLNILSIFILVVAVPLREKKFPTAKFRQLEGGGKDLMALPSKIFFLRLH